MAKFNDTWNSADANQDGLLDLAEFKVYMAATREHMANMGTFAGERPGGDEETYAVCNESNPDREGIALAEYMGVMGHMAVEMAKIKAEEGQWAFSLCCCLSNLVLSPHSSSLKTNQSTYIYLF